MVAIALFLYSIYRFEKNEDRITFYLILQFLALNAYSMLFWDKSIIRNDDLALLMIFYSFFRGGAYKNNTNSITKLVYIYLFAVCMSTIVSFVYYQIPFVQIFKGARSALFVLIVFDLINLKCEDYHKLFHHIFMLTSLAAVVFSFTVITGKVPEIFSGGTGFLGLPRSYGYPPLIAFNCLYLLLVFDKSNKMFIPLLLVSFIALFLIQGRGLIGTTFLSIVIGISLKSNKSNRFWVFLIISVLSVIILSNLVFSGNNAAKTMNDINVISSGDFAHANYEGEGDATFAYRLHLLAMGIIKTVEDPIRLLFGSGILMEMPIDFFKQWNMLECAHWATENYSYFTPDISFPNIILNIGLLGFVIYIIMIYKMWRLLLEKADMGGVYEILGCMSLLFIVMNAFYGFTLTWPQHLIVPFYFVQYVYRKKIREFNFIALLFVFSEFKKRRILLAGK